MLPPISLSTAEPNGSGEKVSRSRLNSSDSGGGFAGLLNRPTSPQTPALPANPAGQPLPPDGNDLPVDEASLPTLSTDLAAAESFTATLEMPGSLGFGALEGDALHGAVAAGEVAAAIDTLPDWLTEAAPADAQSMGSLPLSGGVANPAQAAEASDTVLNLTTQIPWPASGKIPQSSGASRDGSRALEMILNNGTRIADSAAMAVQTRSDTPLSSLSSLSSMLTAASDLQARISQPAASVAQQTLAPLPSQDLALAIEAGKAFAEISTKLEGRLGATSVSPSSPISIASLQALPGSQLPVPPAAAAAPAPLGLALQDPGWGSALGERVLFMTGHGLQTAEIRIVPRELGPITVNLVIEDGAAELTFSAQHAVTREAIEVAIPRLRDMLNDNGISLGNATVTDQGAHSDSQGTEAEQSSKRDDLAASGATLASEKSIGLNGQRVAQGLIDTFV